MGGWANGSEREAGDAQCAIILLDANVVLYSAPLLRNASLSLGVCLSCCSVRGKGIQSKDIFKQVERLF